MGELFDEGPVGFAEVLRFVDDDEVGERGDVGETRDGGLEAGVFPERRVVWFDRAAGFSQELGGVAADGGRGHAVAGFAAQKVAGDGEAEGVGEAEVLHALACGGAAAAKLAGYDGLAGAGATFDVDPRRLGGEVEDLELFFVELDAAGFGGWRALGGDGAAGRFARGGRANRDLESEVLLEPEECSEDEPLT